MTELEALQQALAEEHRAVYLIAYAGGRAAGLGLEKLQASLETAFAAHKLQRSWLEDQIAALGETPAAAELTYPVPQPADRPARIRSLAVSVEQRCVVAYLALVGVAQAESPLRRAAVLAQADAAVRSAGFGAPPEPLPGYDVS